MATIENQEQWKCRSCANSFDTRGRRDAHYKRAHQRKVSGARGNTRNEGVRRAEGEQFACICGRKFWHVFSLKRHEQGCYAAIAMIEGGENISEHQEGIFRLIEE